MRNNNRKENPLLGNHWIVQYSGCKTRRNGRLIIDSPKGLEQILLNAAKKVGAGILHSYSHQFEPQGVTAFVAISESHLSIHSWPEHSSACFDFFTCDPDMDGERVTDYVGREIGASRKENLLLKRSRRSSQVSHDSLWVTSTSGLRRGLELKFEIRKLLVDLKSRYQRILVIENPIFQRMLFLDGDIQIAEKYSGEYNSALVYPISSLRRSVRNAAVLGGGDGGVAHELLKLNPKLIYVIDIDPEVVEISRKYLPGVCNGAFDDSKVKVINADANKFLDDSVKFDAIVYDLTMHPEEIAGGSRESFFEALFPKIVRNLDRGGVFTMQCGSAYDKTTLKFLKEALPRYFKNISFAEKFIPFYCEKWVFASAEEK